MEKEESLLIQLLCVCTHFMCKTILVPCDGRGLPLWVSGKPPPPPRQGVLFSAF